MKLNEENKTNLNIASDLFQSSKKGFGMVSDNLNALNIKEEGQEEQKGNTSDPMRYMNTKGKQGWKKLTSSKKKALMNEEVKKLQRKEKEAKKFQITKADSSEGSGKGIVKTPNAGNKTSGAVTATTKATGSTTASAGGTAVAGATTGGTVLVAKAAKNVAEKFQESLVNSAKERTSKVGALHEKSKKLMESNSDRNTLVGMGKWVGGAGGVALATMLNGINMAATTMLSGMLVVLLPVFIIAVITGGVIALFSIILGGLETSAGGSGGKAMVEVATRELVASNQNVGGKKYKDYYGINGDWCAMFLSWCGNEVDFIELGIIPKTASVRQSVEWYKSKNLYQTKESGYKPKEGDIIIFLNGMSHTGLVVAYDEDTDRVTTIEGNSGASSGSPYHTGSRVTKNTYQRTANSISGYGTPAYPDLVSDLTGATNAEKIFNALVSQGYSKAAAAGVVGNLFQEAGTDENGDIDLHAVESTGEGVGMVQWSFGRKQNFFAFCIEQGQPFPNTGLEVQINFMLMELSSNQWMWSQISAEYGTECNISLQDYKRLTDPDLATKVFCAKFERCHLRHANMNYRQKKAREAFETFSK